MDKMITNEKDVEETVNPFGTHHSKLYAKLYFNEEEVSNINGNNENAYQYQVRFSLVNDGVCKLDQMLNRQNYEILNRYSLFIFEFVGYFNSKEQSKMFWEAYEKLDSNYIACSLVYDRNEAGSDSIRGHVVFGVNSLNMRDAFLKLDFTKKPDLDALNFVDDIDNGFDEYYIIDKENDVKLKKAIEQVLDKRDRPERAEIYNVG